MKSPSELVELFRAKGLKVTPQRRLLFTLLDGNTSHPTAEALHARASGVMPGISLRTVYTTLSDLTDMGELQAHAFGHGATRFDPNVSDHHHGVCDGCGTVIDLYVTGADDLVADGLDGFVATSTAIVFRGACSSCATVPG
ncbi:MAG: Fur family transcriptional regulator [Ilumatobacteraceae bacterium]